MLIRINSHNYLDCSRMWTTNFDSHPTNSTVLFRASDWATFCPIPLQFLATTRNPFHHHRSTHQLHGVIQCSADEMARGNLKPNVIKLIRKCETTTTSRLHLKTHVGTHHVCVCVWVVVTALGILRNYTRHISRAQNGREWHKNVELITFQSFLLQFFAPIATTDRSICSPTFASPIISGDVVADMPHTTPQHRVLYSSNEFFTFMHLSAWNECNYVIQCW